MAGKAATEKLKTQDHPAETLYGARRGGRGMTSSPKSFGVPTWIPASDRAGGRLFAGMTGKGGLGMTLGRRSE